MKLLIFILMLISSNIYSQISIEEVYEITPRTPELELSLSKYEKQTRIGTRCMAVGIVGVMVGHTIVTSLRTMDEDKRGRLHRVNFLTFTPISIFGVYNIVRAPRHIKKYLY